MLPRVFLGSSSENKRLADEVHAQLTDATVLSWHGGAVFEPGEFTLESLVNAADTCDFGIFLIVPEDNSRASRPESARRSR